MIWIMRMRLFSIIYGICKTNVPWIYGSTTVILEQKASIGPILVKTYQICIILLIKMFQDRLGFDQDIPI
jgi:hypothetical protein